MRIPFSLIGGQTFKRFAFFAMDIRLLSGHITGEPNQNVNSVNSYFYVYISVIMFLTLTSDFVRLINNKLLNSLLLRNCADNLNLANIHVVQQP